MRTPLPRLVVLSPLPRNKPLKPWTIAWICD